MARHLAQAGRHRAVWQLDQGLRRSLELQPLARGLTTTLLELTMAGLHTNTATVWMAPLNAACRTFEISRSLRRMAAFLGQVAHESGSLRTLEENMKYLDTNRLTKIYQVFKTEKDAEPYVDNPEALANKVYANRIGNGDAASGDGWRYRGRGLIQLTGRANYAALAKDIDVDVVKDPELLSTPRYAALSAAWFWKKHRLNQLSDAQMYQAVSLRINSSLQSFPQREVKRKRALDALCRAVLTDLVATLGAFAGY